MTSGGLVAIGDSITNGHNGMLARVPGLSWTYWLAAAMDLSYTRYARGGIRSDQVVDEMLPQVRGHYDVGTITMGVNDKLGAWLPSGYQHSVRIALETMTERCDRVVIATVPGSEVCEQYLREQADHYGAYVIDGTVTGIRLLHPDGIHPTALGHLELADRAAAALGVPLPSEKAAFQGQGPVGAEWLVRYPLRKMKWRARKQAHEFIQWYNAQRIPRSIR